MQRLAHTIPEFCELSRLGRTFVFEEIKAGNLPVVRSGRRVLIRDETARQYLADRESTKPSPRARKATKPTR